MWYIYIYSWPLCTAQRYCCNEDWKLQVSVNVEVHVWKAVWYCVHLAVIRSPWGHVISLAMGSVFSLRYTWYSCLCLPDYRHVLPHQACNLTHFQPYTFTAFCNTFIENDIYVIQFSYLKYILWYLEYWEYCKIL